MVAAGTLRINPISTTFRAEERRMEKWRFETNLFFKKKFAFLPSKTVYAKVTGTDTSQRGVFGSLATR